MPFKIEKTQTDFKIAPAGTHPARCVSVIDLGTQEVEWQKKIKYQRKIRISWELPLELEVFNEEKGEQPFIISRDYTLTMDDRGALRKDLEAWRGKKFTEQEAEWFDETKIIGKSCTLTVVHNPNPDGTKTYANISSVTGMMKGVVYPNQISPSLVYNTSDGDNSVYQGLPDWLKEKIANSPEFKNATNPDSQQDPSEEGDASNDEVDKIPF